MNQKLAQELLRVWKDVKSDQAYAANALHNTGPGESPYTREQENMWRLREEFLGRALFNAMPELEPILEQHAELCCNVCSGQHKDADCLK